MAVNSLSPAFMRLTYTTFSRSHVQTLPLRPDGGPVIPGVAPNLSTSTGGSVTFPSFVNTWSALMAAFLTPAQSIGLAEYWSQPTPASDPLFIFAATPSPAVGNNAGTAQQTAQLTFTFRTTLGGILKIVVLESAAPANTNYFPGTANTAVTALVNYVIGNTSVIQGRDGGRPFVFLKALWKTNDKLRKILLDL